MGNTIELKINTNLDSGREVSLPLNGVQSVTVNWGDGASLQTINSSNGQHSHTYASDGTYNITITGNLSQFGNQCFDWKGSEMLTKVVSWDMDSLTSLAGAFKRASNLTSVPDYLPTNVVDLYGLFWCAAKFNDPNIINWDTAKITNMSNMFLCASKFNQPIGSWDVSNVTNMQNMFNQAKKFNQDLNGWDVSNVLLMGSMFYYANAFNGDITAWCPHKVVNMKSMFNHALAFNRDISGWDVSRVSDISDILTEASAFTYDISGWQTNIIKDNDLDIPM